MQNLMSRAESELKNMPLKELLLCVVGLIVGLIIAFFLGQAIATLGSPVDLDYGECGSVYFVRCAWNPRGDVAAR